MPKGSTLTISGYGILNAKSSDAGAGIGGGNHGNCKLITINNGYVQATGGMEFPGIGVGTDKSSTCEGIKINGGEIYSFASENGCVGMGAKMGSDSKCGPIIISNKIKSLCVKNPGASGQSLRHVIFGENIEFGNTAQTLDFLLYL